MDAFLRDAGWKHTSSTPGRFWLWERVIDGRTVLVGKEQALGIQQGFDLHPGDDYEEDDARGMR